MNDTERTLGRALAMLLAPWQWRRNNGSAWALRLYLGLALLLGGAPLAAGLVWLPGRLAWALFGVLAFIGLMLAWLVQFNGLQRLDHPHAARLLPGHRRSVRAVAVGVWLALVALCAAALAAWVGWQGGSAAQVLQLTLGAAALLLFAAWAMCWPWLWLVFWVLWPLSLPVTGPARQALAPLVDLGAPLWQAQPGLVSLAALAAMGAGLVALFGQGDAAHARRYAERETLRQATAESLHGRRVGLAAYGHWGERLARPWQRLADAWLARLLRQARPTADSAMARAEVALYGRQHWVGTVATVLLVQAVLLAALAVAAHLLGADTAQFIGGGALGLGIGAASMALGPLWALPAALWATRDEQRLLMLLPGMPQGAALNRALARRQARQGLLLWCATFPVLGVLVWLDAKPAVLAFWLMFLPLLPWLWRDTARQTDPKPAANLLPMFIWMVLALASMTWLMKQPQVLLPWAAFLLSLAAATAIWRWRQVSRWPQALPAGRLG